MRHPLLRILVALLIGLWSPLCCCQAMTLAGSTCGDAVPEVASSDSCCQDLASSSSDAGDCESGQWDVPAPSDCSSCPSCQGTSGGAGLKVDSRLPSVSHEFNLVATLANTYVLSLPKPDEAVKPSARSWWRTPLHLRANRVSQRWHCALVV